MQIQLRSALCTFYRESTLLNRTYKTVFSTKIKQSQKQYKSNKINKKILKDLNIKNVIQLLLLDVDIILIQGCYETLGNYDR